jgi:hypothetical protein
LKEYFAFLWSYSKTNLRCAYVHRSCGSSPSCHQQRYPLFTLTSVPSQLNVVKLFMITLSDWKISVQNLIAVKELRFSQRCLLGVLSSTT